jgi:hypothetical protein
LNSRKRKLIHDTIKMTTMPPPLDFQHLPGYEIPTKHKEAIR